jgi:phage I-like protein
MKAHIAQIIIAAIQAVNDAPEWFLLFKEGWNDIEGEGQFLVDAKAFELVYHLFNGRGNDIVIDYEHATINGDKAPAAGWISELRYTDGRGIEAKVTWTAEAAEYISKGEYRYFSPVFYVRKSDKRLVGIHSVALTNAPKINNLTPILAKLGEDFKEKEDKGMNELLKKLIAKLGLKAEATEDEVLAAVTASLAKNTELEKQVAAKPKEVEVIAKDVLTALDLKDGDNISTVVASIHALKQGAKGMVSKEEFDKLQKQIREKDASEVVAKAMADGKVTPDQKDWAIQYAERDIEGFKTFVAKAPVVIPMDKLPKQDKKADAIMADEAVLNVAKLFGNTTEDIKKYSGLTA